MANQKAKNLISFWARSGGNPAQLAKALGVQVRDLKDDLDLTPARIEKLKEACKRGWK